MERRAGGGKHARGADADGGRLAGAVGAEQAVELALADTQVDAVDCDDTLFAFVDLAKTLNLDYWRQECSRPLRAI
jgi:hypothetical protein